MGAHPKAHLNTGRTASFWRNWRGVWQWPVIVLIAAAALGLGIDGFMRHNPAASPLDAFYLALQLFTLESGSVSPPVPWQLEVARLLAPLAPIWTVVLTLFAVFREKWDALRLRFIQGHTVVCGIGRKGSQLVERLVERGDKVVIIEKDEGNDWVGHFQELGLPVILSDSRNEAILRKARAAHAKQVFAVTGDDTANVETVARALGLAQDERPPGQPALKCVLHVTDLNLNSILYERPIFSTTGTPFAAEVFNIHQSAARRLLTQYPLNHAKLSAGGDGGQEPLPLQEGDPRRPHLIVVGFGRMGESLTLEALRASHFANGAALRLTVIDLDAARREAELRSRFPQFEQTCDAEFVVADAENPQTVRHVRHLAEDSSHVTTVAVCLNSDAHGITCVLRLLKEFAPDGDTPPLDVPIYVRITADSALVPLIGRHDPNAGGTAAQWERLVVPFDLMDCTALLDGNDEIERTARAIHELYVQKSKEKRSPDDPAMQPWETLDPLLKDSNIQQAIHIPVKLQTVGCFASNAIKGRKPLACFTDGEVELLAKMEHARWNAERWLAGWQLGPRAPKERTSPYLVPWEDLPDNIRDYDRDFVRDIPAILARKQKYVYRAMPGE